VKIVKWWRSLDPEHHFAAPKQAPVEMAGTFFLGSFLHGSIGSMKSEKSWKCNKNFLVLLLTDGGWRIGSAHSTMVHFYRDLVSSDLATCCGAVALLFYRDLVSGDLATCCGAVALPSLDDFQVTGIFVGIPGLYHSSPE